MDKTLIRTITERIVADSRRFDMSTWADIDYRGVAPCGTTFCFAGETVATVLPDAEWWRLDGAFRWQGTNWTYEEAARTMLGLTRPQASRLFYTTAWPRPFFRRYRDAGDGLAIDPSAAREIRAQVLADRVAHFLATDGRE